MNAIKRGTSDNNFRNMNDEILQTDAPLVMNTHLRRPKQMHHYVVTHFSALLLSATQNCRCVDASGARNGNCDIHNLCVYPHTITYLISVFYHHQHHSCRLRLLQEYYAQISPEHTEASSTFARHRKKRA